MNVMNCNWTAACLTEPIGPHQHLILAFAASPIPASPLKTDLVIDASDADFAAREPEGRRRGPDYAVAPPSTTKVRPVTKLASSEARKATMAASSSGRPIRLSG